MRTSNPIERGRRRFAIAWLASLAISGCAVAPASLDVPDAPDAAIRQALAPTGTLRIGVYPGSPTSLVQRAGQPDAGVSVEVGRELARRLGVPAELKVYPRVAEVIAALQSGQADVTITNATPERAALMDFAPPVLSLELGVLVPQGSPVVAVESIDQAGVRVGVSQGSSSERSLKARLKNASVVALPSLEAVRAALAAGQLEAFATNKAVLFELQTKTPGTRVLEGRWGLEHLALGTGKGRDVALPWLRRFSGSVKGGLVSAAAERAGLRGLAPPERP
jgi:polar amino acid transport system substrate-binding protein